MKIVYKRMHKNHSSTPHSATYLFKSIQQLITNTNDNERKLDDIFLKQSTVPNLLFTAAFLSTNFRCLLINSPLFTYIYLCVMCSFFVTLLSTIIAATIEKRNAKYKLKKSQDLYDKVEEKIVLSSDDEELVRKQIKLNNQTDDSCLLIIVYFIEDIMRIANSIFIIPFIIYGVYLYVR